MQIIPDLDTGGAELSTIEIAGAIRQAGGTPLVLSRGGRLNGALKAAGGDLIEFPAATKNPLQILSNGRKIAALLKNTGAALIHARSRAPAWSALLAARHAKVPFVTTYHGAYNEKGPAKRFYNSVMARGDLVIANSQYTADLIRSRYGTSEDIIRIIHRGVDMDRFDPAKIPADRIEDLRQSWGLVAGERAILHPARLTSWKGQSTVIAAAGLLKEQGLLDGVVFILAGDAQGRDAYAEGLKSQIAEAGLESHVRLVGHVADMPTAYATSSGALVASVEPEAFGRTATEAQAMGCPVIATAIGAPPETVKAGWLVKPAAPQDLAEKLGILLRQSPDEAKAFAAVGRPHVEANFSLLAMKTKTLKVYDELLSAGLTEAFRSSNRS
ncbi:MAG: glycosyltransferase family 4 protein [Filomicrobium sp.]